MKSNYKKILDWFVNLYLVWIISSSFIGFFYLPAFNWFTGSYTTGALAVIMLGMGLTLRIEDFPNAFINLLKIKPIVDSLNKLKDENQELEFIKAMLYDIPLRSLIAKDVNGLMMAGRCISGDFFAHASYRVTGNAVAMGEAAGQVAAKAALENKLPQQIGFKGIVE